MLIVDSEGAIINASLNTSANAVASAASLIGRDIRSLLGERTYQLLAEVFEEVLISGRKRYIQSRIDLPHGPRWFQLLLVPLHAAADGSKRILLISKDFTARKESHHKLRKSEALLLQAEELARLGSFQVDLRTWAVVWSRQLYRNLGLDPRHGITWPQFLKMVHPEDRDRLVHDFEQSVKHKKILDGEFRCILANGEVRILHRRAIPLYDDAGAPLALVGMSQDVTERKLSEEHLRNREALLSQAEQLANLGSWEWNLETSQITWSDHRFRLMGLEPGAFCPTIDAFWRTLHPDDLERVRAQFRRAIDQAHPLEYEARFVLADGRVRILHTRGVPIVNSEGRTIRLAGMAQDVTERRNEEDRLRRSEALLVQAEEIANVGSWEYDVKSSRSILSQQLLRMYGIASQAEWDDKWNEDRFWNRALLPDVDSVRAQCMRAIEECKPFEFTTRYRLPDGVVRVYQVKGKPCPGEDGSTERVLGVVRDITDHTRTEEDLRRLSQQLIRTRDSERRQLARELHESAGQSLAALKMSLGNLREVLPEENHAAFERLDAARGFAEDAIREVRVISYYTYCVS
jgi:PAS domain S-box-containing protein